MTEAEWKNALKAHHICPNCKSVDACFFYGLTDAPTVTFTARWTYGARDLDKLGEAAELIKTMLYNMSVESVLENLTADSDGDAE